MRLATRLFIASGLLVLVTVAGLIVATDGILRAGLEREVVQGLEREARLVAVLLPADSAAWPEEAQRLGRLIGRRVTLIAPDGRVLGDSEFDRVALGQLENHGSRPEVVAARGDRAGRDRRVSASTFAPQMYVAVRDGPPGVAVTRVSRELDAVAAQVGAVRRAVVVAGLFALAAAALLAGLSSIVLARPLVQLTTAARDIAAGRPPRFPESHITEVERHARALRGMHDELATQFAELRREREEMRTVLEAMTDGVIASNARGDVVASNTAARRLLGFADAAPLPPLAELFHDKTARTLMERLARGAEMDQETLELEGRSLLAAGRALPDGGRLLVLRDVTDLRRLETMRRDFVANVSHELKTPLTSIAGYAETLAGETLADSPSRRFADTILTNAQRMQRLVDDLLDLSRIESGGWRPRTQPVELATAIGEAWTPFAGRAREAGVTLDVATDEQAPTVSVDPDALRQVLTNLFTNALRHTPSGGRIRVATRSEPEAVRLTVSDTGAGIPAEHLPRIFERFYRIDPGRAREQGGTGLGLAIVKHLIEAHGGRVAAESAIGRGTAIHVILPSKPAS